MVLLSTMGLWLSLATAGERIEVLVLPPVVEAGAERLPAASIGVALAAGISLQPGFSGSQLRDSDNATLQATPGCRDDAACLAALLPKDVDLVLDARLKVHGDTASADLRLRLPDGSWSRRFAVAIGATTAPSDVTATLPQLLAGWSRPSRLYGLAIAGDEEARSQLIARYPDDPWTLALPARATER
jgi:hypothetical protein